MLYEENDRIGELFNVFISCLMINLNFHFAVVKSRKADFEHQIKEILQQSARNDQVSFKLT